MIDGVCSYAYYSFFMCTYNLFISYYPPCLPCLAPAHMVVSSSSSRWVGRTVLSKTDLCLSVCLSLGLSYVSCFRM